MENTNDELLDEFYNQDFFFSYSSLNKLLYAPITFYNWYILQEREDKLESYLMEGKVIHCLLLDKESFNKQFIVMPGSVPTATSFKVVNAIYKLWKNTVEKDLNKTLKDYSSEILQWLVDDNTYQKLSDDTKRLDKILTTENETYFQFLLSSENKDIIDQQTLDRCNEIVELLKQNTKIKELIKYNRKSDDFTEIYNEKMLKVKISDWKFGIKGIIDNFVIDHLSETIYINDLKTTSKTLHDFEDSVDYYKYWLQAGIYKKLAKAFAKSKGYENYKIKFHFIVIDKYNQIYAFPVSNNTLSDWSIKTGEVLEEAKYHYENKQYDLPKTFALDQIEL